VVVNDELSIDRMRQEIMSLAIPASVQVVFIPHERVRQTCRQLSASAVPALVLFADCGDVVLAVGQGLAIPVLNVGNLHYSEGKRQICPHVAVDKRDIDNFEILREKGVRFDFRSVPGDVPRCKKIPGYTPFDLP
jgi:PTS system mannose-specific IIB component